MTRQPSRHASGRFLLRLPPPLHEALREAAREAGTSLNDYCVRRLAAPAGNPAALRGANAAVERAAEMLGSGLMAVVVYGSWARGEATAASDVDLLIVLGPGVPLTRSLYRQWDASPLAWDGHPVEPHFVHLGDPADRPTGLWAEAAIDGIVLFERGTRTSQHLAQVRREILAGRLVRRTVHGQPYWSEVA